MSKIFDHPLFKSLYTVLWMVVLAKAIALSLYFILPHYRSETELYFKNDLPYVDVDIQKAFKLSASKTKKQRHILQTDKPPQLQAKDIELKGTYIDKNNSFAILSISKNSKEQIKIVKPDDRFFGYKVVKIYPHKIVLEKNFKQYVLYFKEKKDKDAGFENTKVYIDKNGGSVVLKKEEVYKYASNFDKIWKEIKIDDLRKNGKLHGFLVKWIKKKSIFAQIGLKPGDMIVKIDGKPIKSYADAFIYYEKIKKRELYILRLTVIRNHKEKEIEYELL